MAEIREKPRELCRLSGVCIGVRLKVRLKVGLGSSGEYPEGPINLSG
jgi:hypothetical protein